MPAAKTLAKSTGPATKTAPILNALDTAVRADKPVLCELTVGDETFDVVRKPSVLLLSELARVESGAPEAVAVIAEFFATVLGKDNYRAFKAAVYETEMADDDLLALIGVVVEGTLGTPTQ